MDGHIDETIQVSPYQDKPITHTVIVTAPIQIHRWAVSEDLAEQKAQEYREKGYTVRIEKGAK